MFKVVPVDVYNTDVLVSIAQTDEELYNSIGSEHFTKEDFEECYNDWTMDARVVSHPTKGFIIMRFRNIIEEHGIIAHEAFHAAYTLLDKVGMRCNYETEEAYAYLIGFLTNKIAEINYELQASKTE